MICLNCENEKFSSKKVRSEQEFKGRTFNVLTDAMVCDECGSEQFTDDQANAVRRLTVDAYKKEEKLLTSEEVRKYREELGMSQVQFAEYLGVGVASVKRWETYFIQEKSQDDLIRIKCDPEFAQVNAMKVKWAHDQPNEFNGHRKFDLKVCQNVLAKIIEIAPSPLFFFKAVFYMDFLHFKRFGKGITGMQYSCLAYGPIPKDYDHLLEFLVEGKVLSPSGKHNLKSNIKFDESLFSTDELATINFIYGLVEKHGKDYLLNKSHEEDAFTNCSVLGRLNYKDAKTLKIA